MTLCDILKAKGNTVFTIIPEATLEEAIRELVKRNVGALVVCQRDIDCGERLAGIITERDLIRFCATAEASLVEFKVHDVMTAHVVTGTLQDSVESTMQLMTTRRIRHLPILSEGRLVGIVSIGDVVKNQLDQLAMENHFMKNYITG